MYCHDSEDRVQLIRKQAEYCEQNNLPVFIDNDGRCANCGSDIFLDASTRDKADHALITGCPFCFKSFCE